MFLALLVATSKRVSVRQGGSMRKEMHVNETAIYWTWARSATRCVKL